MGTDVQGLPLKGTGQAGLDALTGYRKAGATSVTNTNTVDAKAEIILEEALAAAS